MNGRVNQERGTDNFWKLGARKAAKIGTPCPLMVNRNMETAFGGNMSGFFLFARQGGEHSRLAPQELCPPLWGIGRGFYILMKVLHFFFFSFSRFENNHSWHRATQQPGLVSLKLSAHDFLKCRMLQERVGGERCQVQCII